MSALTPQSNSKWPLRRVMKFLFIGFFVSVIFLAVIEFILTQTARSELRSRIKAIQAQGYPVNADDLLPPPLADNENAAVLYETVFSSIYKDQYDLVPAVENAVNYYSYGTLPEVEEGEKPITEEDVLSDFSAFLTSHQQALETLHRAAAMHACQFSLDDVEFVGDLSISAGKTRGAVKLCATIVKYYNQPENQDEALEFLCTALRIGNAHQERQFILEQYVQMAIYGIALGSTRKFVMNNTCTPKQLRTILAAMPSINTQSIYPSYLRKERASFLSYYHKTLKNIYNVNGVLAMTDVPAWLTRNSVAANTWNHSHFRYKDALFALDFFDACLQEQETESFLLRRGNFALKEVLDQTPALFIFSQFSLKYILSVEMIMYGVESNIKLTTLGIHLELYKLDHGSYPDTIDAIEGDWIDPCTGKLIEYTNDGHQFTLFSPGADGFRDAKTGPQNDIHWPNPDIDWEEDE